MVKYFNYILNSIFAETLDLGPQQPTIYNKVLEYLVLWKLPCASSLLCLLAAVDRQVCLKCPTVQMLVHHSWRRLFHGELARSPFMPFMKVSVQWLHSATWLIEHSLLKKLNDFFQYEKKSTLVLVFNLS